MIRGTSLRRTLIVSIGLLGTAAFTASGALVLITSVLHGTTRSLDAALQALRLAERVQAGLVLVERSSDPISRARLISQLRDGVTELREHDAGGAEAQAVARAHSAVVAYLEALPSAISVSPERTHLFAAAERALEELVEINVVQGEAAQLQAARWDRRADWIGAASIVLVSAIVSFLAWYLRAALNPVLPLADVMERFGRGETGVRAAPSGPAELRAIAERFNGMADALASRREARLAFLSGIAHDLRAPLNVLSLSLELLRSEPPLPPDERRGILDRVRRQLGRLERMTSDFLDRAHIESGRFELSREHLDAREIVERACELFVGASEIHVVEASVPGEPVLLPCDPLRVEQVLTNLIGNAIKYSPRGGAVRVRLRDAGEMVVLSVSDEGLGITEDDQRKIFEPFHRSSRVRAELPGTGLGLSIVRQLVEAHGGTVRVSSRLDCGSTFEVHLPRRAVPGRPAAEMPEPVAGTGT